jgi:2-haloacid dehalogenase
MDTNIKSFIFDFGGVLLQWDPWSLYRRHFPNETDIAERFFNEADFAGWNAHQDKGCSFKEGVAVLSAQFPQYAHLIKAYHEHWIDSIVGMFDGTVEILNQLKQKGYPLYGLSNWSTETYPLAREKYHFFDLLDEIVLSGDVGHNKPEPEIYHIMLEKIGKPAQECLFIDDSLLNIQQAQKLGFRTIHFESPEQLRESLQGLEIL